MNTTDRVAAPSAAICDLTARPLITAPFPYVTHSHFIKPEFYQQLRASFPICPPSTGSTGFSLYWGDAAYQQLLDEHPTWQALFNTFHSQQFIDWCVNQFAAVWEQEGCQLDLAEARYIPYREDRIDKERATLRQIEYEPHELWVRMDVHQGRVGYARHIHLDHARRLLSMLVYLCDHAENQMTGGELFLHTAAQLPEEQAPPVRITPQHNLMVAFPCMRRSHHSVSAITAMVAPRNYLQVHISSSVDIWEPIAKLRQMTVGLAAYALGDYAVTRLGESRALVVKEQLLREARSLAARLPADFVHAHPELIVTVVMLSHGRLAQTLNAIRALQEHVRIPFKLLLVDNDSGAEVQGQLAEVSRHDERIELILLDENLGCAGGRAYALARVTTPYALLIDNDVEVLSGAVEHLLHYLEQEAEAAAVMGKIVLPDGALHLCGGDYRVVDGVLHFELLGSGRRFDEQIGASGSCRWVSGTLTMVRTAVFADHPYDLGLRHYYEDLEWCYRLNKMGAGAFHRCVEALGIHNHEAKTPAAALSATEQRRQAIKYVATIAHFYRQHEVIIPNLFDFVPELRTADGQPNLAAARLLLALVNAYGDEWALAQWERGEFAPLFAELGGAPSRSAAREIEPSAGADELTLLKQELAVRQAELHARQHELEACERALAQSRSEIAALSAQAAARQSAWEQWLAQSAKREQELAVIFHSRSWRALDLYWRARRALRSIVARQGKDPRVGKG